MSRAFVKEDAETALLVPRRAPLPDGARNYVTHRGLELLQHELSGLLAELVAAERDGGSGQAAFTALRARIQELEGRLASAEPVEIGDGELDVVRFGLEVTVRGEHAAERTFRIVGVDEANAAEGRIAFVAPLARALLGKRVGDVATARTPRGDEELEVVAIAR